MHAIKIKTMQVLLVEAFVVTKTPNHVWVENGAGFRAPAQVGLDKPQEGRWSEAATMRKKTKEEQDGRAEEENQTMQEQSRRRPQQKSGIHTEV